MKRENMTFTEAMLLAYDAPVGYPNPILVGRPGKLLGFIYYDPTMFLGSVPFGLTHGINRKQSGVPYSPCIDDIRATDWQTIALEDADTMAMRGTPA